MQEIWKDIKGYEGRYQVSNLGNIMSLKKNKILKVFPDGDGYLLASLYDGKKKTFRVHRIVATHFIENILNKEQINHKDCNKQNNSVSNLEWVTRRENTEHAVNNGLYNNGLNNLDIKDNPRNSKITKKQAIEIREVYSKKRISHSELGSMYGLKRSAISDIINKKSWK